MKVSFVYKVKCQVTAARWKMEYIWLQDRHAGVSKAKENANQIWYIHMKGILHKSLLLRCVTSVSVISKGSVIEFVII